MKKFITLLVLSSTVAAHAGGSLNEVAGKQVREGLIEQLQIAKLKCSAPGFDLDADQEKTLNTSIINNAIYALETSKTKMSHDKDDSQALVFKANLQEMVQFQSYELKFEFTMSEDLVITNISSKTNTVDIKHSGSKTYLKRGDVEAVDCFVKI